jgi:hypothetical protein
MSLVWNRAVNDMICHLCGIGQLMTRFVTMLLPPPVFQLRVESIALLCRMGCRHIGCGNRTALPCSVLQSPTCCILVLWYSVCFNSVPAFMLAQQADTPVCDLVCSQVVWDKCVLFFSLFCTALHCALQGTVLCCTLDTAHRKTWPTFGEYRSIDWQLTFLSCIAMNSLRAVIYCANLHCYVLKYPSVSI